MDLPSQTEAPYGYKIVRIGVKGRKPKIGKTAKETLSVNQRKDFNYREKNREKILAYQREYYQKRKAKKLSDVAGVR
jgi:hypothetical protein|tara:strand:- start:898 stop:1128 length:231 start_codon:yes stop_codon:yes gene_type:complete